MLFLKYRFNKTVYTICSLIIMNHTVYNNCSFQLSYLRSRRHRDTENSENTLTPRHRRNRDTVDNKTPKTP